MKKFFFFVLSSILVFILTLYFHLGGNKSVTIEYKVMPPLALLYKEHTGPYHKIEEVIESVEAWAAKNNIPCPRTFGEYLDDPQLVEERRLRSLGGCLTMSVAPDQGDFHYKQTVEKKYVVAKFDGAPSIGPMKVYPKVNEYILDHHLKKTGTVIEIYTINGENNVTTEYLFSVSE